MTALQHNEGFTLLEVVIALAIFALAMGAIFPMFLSVPSRMDSTLAAQEALLKAEAILREQTQMGVWAGLSGGADSTDWQTTVDGWRWRITEIPVEAPDEDKRVPGRPLTLQVQVRAAEGQGPVQTLHRTLWVVD